MDVNQTSNTPMNHSEEVIDLLYYWRIFMSHKWGILSFSCISTLLAILIVLNITPIYKSTSTLLIESKNANIVSIQEVYGLDGSSEYLLTQFEILKSRKLAKRVIKKLDLMNHPVFNVKESKLPEQLSFLKDINPKRLIAEYFPDLFQSKQPKVISKETQLEYFTDVYLKSLSITSIRKTQLVKISFESSDAELAAQVANEIANSYIEGNLAAKLELTVTATSWLNDQLKEQRVDLTTAEKRLQQYRETEGIIGKNGGLGIAEREIDLVSTKLVDAKRELLELKSVYQQIQKVGRKSSSNLQLIPRILSHKLVQNLKDAVAIVELKRSEVANRYGKKHPKMKAINSELSRAYGNLNKQIISIARGIENNYKVAVEAVASLEESLAATKGDMQVLSGKEYKLKDLQQDVDTKRQLYEQFYTRFSETNATGDLVTANARITDEASIANLPVKHKKKLIVALSFVVSFVFAVMVAFLLKSLDNTLKTSLEVEQKLGEILLGLLPLLPTKRRQPNPSYKQYIEDPHSGYSESLRTIRTGLILSSLDNPDRIFCVTSTAPGEGKTSTSLGLAFSLAQVGSVLLIDADMRRPSIHKALGLENYKIGLSNLVAQTSTMENSIQTYEQGGFDILPCGTIPPNPSELLSSQRFKDLITGLAKIYDRIIIDTAPCQAVSDALVLAPLVSNYIYVVKSDSTHVQHAKNGLKRIRQVDGKVLGIVLNRVDVKKAEKYYGEDYSGYYDSYGYSGASS
jgi:capsular exopolysaccharide synthesis family protein